tara:strand:+ start:9120 stop:9356 length:237 start_codon:yes stop_codon:yes gene_type:complete
MHFTARENESEEEVWKLIQKNLKPEVASCVCPASSSFYRTKDGIECSIRKSNGELIANGYSESDRMGKRRWSFEFPSN